MRFGRRHRRRLMAAVLLTTCWFVVGLADLALAWPEAGGDECFMGCAVEAGETCCCIGNRYGARHAAEHHSADQAPMVWWQATALACPSLELTLPGASSLLEVPMARHQSFQLPPALAAQVAAYDGARRAELRLLALSPRPPPAFV